MRPLSKVVSTALLFVAPASIFTWGCWPLDYNDDCEIVGACPIPLSTGSGGDGGTPDACVPSKNAGAAVSNACGVFASDSLGDDNTGDGTKEKPYKTLATAFMRAEGRPVYACSETFAEAVVLTAGSKLYGGLGCQGWTYGGDTVRTTIAPGPDEIPITLSSGSTAITVENVVAWAATATQPGGSSVALMASDGAAAALTRCDLTAGSGAAGAHGIPGDPNGMPAAGGQQGNPGATACTADTAVGGSQTINDCSGVMSIGASGGNGEIANGGNGANGTPDLGAGQGGIGEPAMGSWGCGFGQGGGNAGNNGTPGEPGAGAMGLGMLAGSGYMGVTGGDGKPGTPAQGGGGGGGAKGGTACSGPTKGGASGGSGGSGGCGGLPGKGAGPGGASIGLISFNANLTLTDCTITTASGGAGGKGGDAQAGGAGGPGGTGGSNNGIAGLLGGCKGGDGGSGGSGGPGGGGLGGPSIGIAHTGMEPEHATATITRGTGGPGGPGGNNNSASNKGADGIANDVQQF